jgi:small-conductance mechanosensitive channel
VSGEQETVSPLAITRPPLRLISLPEAATAQWMTSVPPEVSSEALAIGEALPAALVSGLMVLAVAVPEARYFTVRTWVWGQAVVVTGDLVTNKRGAVDSRWATYKDARRAAREFQARLSGGVDAMGRPALLRVS